MISGTVVLDVTSISTLKHTARRLLRQGVVWTALVRGFGGCAATHVKGTGPAPHASWRDQVEIICSKVQRSLLTPNDFPSTLALEKQLKTYCDALHRHLKPMQWTYTKTTLLAKCGTSQPAELAA